MTNFRIDRLPYDSRRLAVWADSDPKNLNWPVVYILRSEDQIYVGETTNVVRRLQQHMSEGKKTGLTHVTVLFNDSYNKSACLDLESSLISHLSGDGRFELLNQNDGLVDAEYFDRSSYVQGFQPLFEALLKEGIFSRSVPDIVNSNLFKFSPFKSLNLEQADAVERILTMLFAGLGSGKGRSLVLQGDPGTGKTIVAIFLVKLLSDVSSKRTNEGDNVDTLFSDFFSPSHQELAANLRVGLVIPQKSLRKTIQSVFQKTPGLDKSMVLTAFEAAERGELFDLLIVDEAHRLNRRANQPSAKQNSAFPRINKALFGEDNPELTQIDWIRACSKHQLYLIDAAQSVKPADVPRQLLDELRAQAQGEHGFFQLASQMRVAGGSDYIDYVRRVLGGSQVEGKSFGEYDVRFYEDIGEMKLAIAEKDQKHGLSRIVAGFAWPWVSKAAPEKFDIFLDGVGLHWNRTLADWINSPTSPEEVGSIHTVQGYDLNYAGVIIGADLGFDPDSQQIVFRRENYFDKKGKENNPQLGIIYTDDDLLGYVKNIYRVLLTRGVKGTFVYVVDRDLREHLRPFFTASQPNSLEP